MMLILLAGLQSRPLDVIEAARIDGASTWQIFRYMTFPHMRQYLELGALLGSIYVVQTFDAVFVITSGGLGTANLPFTIYQTFYNAQDYGRASAAGVVTVIGTIIIATFALRTVSTLFREEEWTMSSTPDVGPDPGDPHSAGRPRGDRTSARRHPSSASRMAGRLSSSSCRSLWMLLTSFHSESDAATNPPSVAAPLTLQGYREFFGESSGASPWPSLANSLTASVLSTILVLLLAIPGGVRAVDPPGSQVDRRHVLLPLHQDAPGRRRPPADLPVRAAGRAARQHLAAQHPLHRR